MALAGENIDAADINALQRFYAIKVADESVTSSTTPQNDDDLSAVLDVGVWEVHAYLSAFSASVTPGIRFGWNTSGTMTCLGRQMNGPALTATNTLGPDSKPRYSGNQSFAQAIFGMDGSAITCFYDHLIVDVDVAGTLVLQWAQGASNGTASTMKAGSSMTWRLLAAG